jgi:hypothetical protein
VKQEAEEEEEKGEQKEEVDASQSSPPRGRSTKGERHFADGIDRK